MGASTWLRDDENDEACLVMVLNKSAPYYTVLELEATNALYVNGQVKRIWAVSSFQHFPNINPATEHYAASGGDY